jgi:hypothetical protein
MALGWWLPIMVDSIWLLPLACNEPEWTKAGMCWMPITFMGSCHQFPATALLAFCALRTLAAWPIAVAAAFCCSLLNSGLAPVAACPDFKVAGLKISK